MTHEVAGEELVLAIVARSNPRDREFERVMRDHERMVVNTAYRLLGRMEDARDAAQEVFLRLLKNLNRIEGDPKPWLYRVTVNVCNDHYRRRLPVKEPDARRADPTPDASRILEMGDRKRLLMEALATLSPRERAAIVLRDIEGLSTREVAGILGIEEVTVRSQISVARVKLAKFVRGRK
ncbi:MAG TPA: sigma-70 family RNA polymerase sigma factor [Bryobacteraceae bacterium]|nr:sigma-70 family RNA polymerase sigma factor [Bryobacteraceae bacterium]